MKGAPEQMTRSGFDAVAALTTLSDRLRKKKQEDLSLAEVIGITELLADSLQPLLRRIDATIQTELRDILRRIDGLRAEIAEVGAEEISQHRIPEVGRELSAVVSSTEGATHSIMEAAEAVLAADRVDPGYAELVSEKMMSIFECCSFQDLTGQRVNKVVETIEVIEERISRLSLMLNTNGVAIEATTLSGREQRKKEQLLNGPAHDGEGVAQSDIDKLF